jgi:hypothetical protein
MKLFCALCAVLIVSSCAFAPARPSLSPYEGSSLCAVRRSKPTPTLGKKKGEPAWETAYRQRFSQSALDDLKTQRARDKGAYSGARRAKLGVKAGEEYDLEGALFANTDDTITKVRSHRTARRHACVILTHTRPRWSRAR